jgi:hypothetical protein
MLITEDYLNKIISTPETDQGAWNEFTNGFVDGFQIPFLGAILGIQEKNTLKNTIDRYQKSGMDLFDVSLVVLTQISRGDPLDSVLDNIVVILASPIVSLTPQNLLQTT